MDTEWGFCCESRPPGGLSLWGMLALLVSFGPAVGAEDAREPVSLPPMMQEHMLANMRDHLQGIDEILAAMAEGRMDRAASVAEDRLGMSALERHGASHMAPYFPEGMREAGSGMHRAASRFARVAQEGEPLAAYAALREVTASCVACHAAYRLR
jgi:hypothetical protein